MSPLLENIGYLIISRVLKIEINSLQSSQTPSATTVSY